MATRIEELMAPKVDEREWVRLQEELAYLFAKPLGMSRGEYLVTLPAYTPQPIEHRDRFDRVVLVQPPKLTKGLTLKRILEIVGLSFDPRLLKMKLWTGDPGGFRTPTVSYGTWLEDGEKRLGVSASFVRDNLAEDERGGTGLDGIFLYVADRGIIRRHFLDLPGSEVLSPNHVPMLELGGIFESGPYFSGHVADTERLNYGYIGYGSVVAARKVVVASNTRMISRFL